jgi:flagellum-specific ATP synthase
MKSVPIKSSIDFGRYFRLLQSGDSCVSLGTVTDMVGLLIESSGPAAAMGDFCEIRTSTGRVIRVQVIGFRNGRILSMPLEESSGIQLGDRIVSRPVAARVKVGDGLLGRVLDGFGDPMDGGAPLEPEALYDLFATPPGPLEREHIVDPLVTGIRAIDGLLPCGKDNAWDSSAAAASERARCSAPCAAIARLTSA